MLVHDWELRQGLERAARPERPVDWLEVHQLGALLAVFGFTDQALSLWRFLYWHQIPVPEPLYTSQHGDLIISAVCHTMETPDFSRGHPASVHCGAGWSLRQRVDANERRGRMELTTDRWLPQALVNPEFPPLHALADYRRALAVARPGPGGEPPRRELEAVPLLEEYLQSVDPEQRDPIRPPTTAINAALLAADISARHLRADDAKRFLDTWYGWRIHFPANAPLEFAFALRSVCMLFAAETLASRTALTVEEVRELVHAVTSASRPSAPDPTSDDLG